MYPGNFYGQFLTVVSMAGGGPGPLEEGHQAAFHPGKGDAVKFAAFDDRDRCPP